MRRRTAPLVAGSLLVIGSLLAAGCSGGSGSGDGTAAGPEAAVSAAPGQEPAFLLAAAPITKPPTLPRGGRTIFPDYRLVGFSGGRSPAFGRLVPEDLDGAAAAIEDLGAQYAGDGRTILPVFELITVVAHGSPTASGLYRTHEPDEVIEQYLAAAREHQALLLLNIQPGRADFLADVKAFEKWLLEPDVGVALDPEWAVDRNEVPGRVYGSTTGAELDGVAAYLAGLVEQYDLPEKVMVFHQVHASVVIDEPALQRHPGVVQIKSVDGIGARANKESTWSRLMPPQAPQVHAGFKLFFDEDAELGPLMTPAEVMALRPLPEYVLYE